MQKLNTTTQRGKHAHRKEGNQKKKAKQNEKDVIE